MSIEEVSQMFRTKGDSQYGGEQVSQLEHALQAAMLAEREKAPTSLIAAALLHDVGHLLHSLPDDAPEQGIDDCHENSGKNFLRHHFPESVTEPIRLHVAAKRYLCAVEPGYLQTLSEPSVVSLGLQGGPMSQQEVDDFRAHPYAEEAVRLRRWDDEAKVPGLQTPPLEHFEKYLQEVLVSKV